MLEAGSEENPRPQSLDFRYYPHDAADDDLGIAHCIDRDFAVEITHASRIEAFINN